MSEQDNELIAKYIMGWEKRLQKRLHHDIYIWREGDKMTCESYYWHPEREIVQAMMVAERLREMGWNVITYQVADYNGDGTTIFAGENHRISPNTSYRCQLNWWGDGPPPYEGDGIWGYSPDRLEAAITAAAAQVVEAIKAERSQG